MNNTILSFIITFLSGFSTMIGTIIIFLNYKNNNKVISYSLVFSSSIMLFISIFDLIPTSFTYFSKTYIFLLSLLLIFIYSIFGSLLVRFIDKKNNSTNKLYKVGIVSLIALILHNIPEGMITFISSSKDMSLGIFLTLSIALHNIPEGIAISVPIYYGENNRLKALFYTLVAALSEPFGALIAFLFFRDINDYLFAVILSFTAGIMIYLSIFEQIFEASKYYNKKLIIIFLLGVLIMIISKILI